MEVNPYESPRILAEPTRRHVVAQRFTATTPRVDGKWLVVRSGDELPRLCVKTGQPVSVLEVTTKEFTWCSPLLGLLLRQRCYVTFGLSERLRRRYRNRFIFKAASACVLFMAVPMTAGSVGNAGMVVLILFIAAVASLFFGNSPLAVTNCRGDEFWMAGCSQEFLHSIESADDPRLA